MKILVDAMLDGWDDRLNLMGHDAYSVKKLERQGHKLERDDCSVIDYARAGGMILVTKDQRCANNCKTLGIQCVLLDDDHLFSALLIEISRM